MTRWKSLLCAAIAAIAAAVGVSYMVFPAQGGAAELSVTQTPNTPRTTDEKPDGNLHRVREHPMRQGRIASPFLPEHPTRADVKKAMASSKQTPPQKNTVPPEPTAPQEIRLVGVVSAGTGRRAIVAVGKKQMLLAVGEEKDGVTLVSLAEKEAVVSTAAGERTLALASGLSR